ncbi:PepSY domain-containing protein [Ensifer sesbaniae]|uniref:PepSY domain-containing protein n=1 Tax=Ensifer sesbaniae TaxID=1214071 RepID=UPI0020010648|nr:PepSY domain-containing protein [Ensifer sesbaniae]
MKRTTLAMAALFGVVAMPAFAQTTPNFDGETPAIATPDSINPTAPVAGASSFTEAQAKDRIEKAGYASVQGLKLDSQGVWRAAATRGGKSVEVALDYQGNVTSQSKK